MSFGRDNEVIEVQNLRVGMSHAAVPLQTGSNYKIQALLVSTTVSIHCSNCGLWPYSSRKSMTLRGQAERGLTPR